MVFRRFYEAMPEPRLATTPTNRSRRSRSSPGVSYAPSVARNRGGSALGELAIEVALHVAVLDRGALVEAVLATRGRELDLRAPVGEVDPRRDDRQALLGDPAEEALDLTPVEQELARALGLVVLPRRRLVGRDVQVVEPHLAVADDRVGVLQLGAPVAQGLDLGALQHHAGLDLV